MRLFCAYGGDGNSMAHSCGGGYGDGVTCIPGCYPRGGQCHEVHRDWTCSWPPSMLRDALQAQLARSDPSNTWNEMVIDTRSVEADYVGAVLGFFYLAPSGAGRGPARSERAAFARAFGLSDDAAPVVAVDLGARGGAASPAFRLG